MKDEITGQEIKEGREILFVDYKNWIEGIFHKGITLEEINKMCDSYFKVIPAIVLINKPNGE